jgi:ATP-binding cassette, subfamily B, bacterial MsbA
VYFYLVMNSATKFGVLTTFRSSLANVEASVQKVEDVLSDEGKYFVPSGQKQFTGLRQSIEFRSMNFVFPNGNVVLNNLSFAIEKGKMTAIVGPTGAGKTTIINVLLRFYDCPEASLFVDEVDIRSYNTASLRRHTGIVSQETLLLHDTLRNNIIYGLDHVPEEKLQSAVKHSRLALFIDELPEGLETLIGDRGVKLSGGEKQRVSIARALLKEADILVLDEATSSLDSRTERLIQEAIDDAVSGRTSVVIAHRLSTIKHADKIVVVEGGTVVEEGTLDELLGKKGVFYGLWEEQKFT